MFLVGLLALAIFGLTSWLVDPTPVGSIQPRGVKGPPAVKALEDHIMPNAEKVQDPGGGGVSSRHRIRRQLAARAQHRYTAVPGELELEPDYEAQLRGEDLPPALLNLFEAAFVEFYRGNTEYAAMLALDALEISDDYPVVKKPRLHGIVGHSYELLGYFDMAIEHYRAALAIYPLQRTSYDGMRRLDAEFARTHPELPIKPGSHS